MPRYQAHSSRQARHFPTRRAGSSSSAGFTLLEILIVIFLIGIISLIGLYRFEGAIERLRVESAARQSIALINRARMEAIQRQAPVVVEIVGGELQTFIDLHDAAGVRTSDLTFNPVAALPEGETDLVFDEFVSENASYVGPHTGTPDEQLTVRGLTRTADGRTVAVFEPSGTLRDTGAFRLTSSDGDNSFEIALDTMSGTAELLKYLHSGPRGAGAGFYGRSSASGHEVAWVWY